MLTVVMDEPHDVQAPEPRTDFQLPSGHSAGRAGGQEQRYRYADTLDVRAAVRDDDALCAHAPVQFAPPFGPV